MYDHTCPVLATVITHVCVSMNFASGNETYSIKNNKLREYDDKNMRNLIHLIGINVSEYISNFCALNRITK